MTTTSFQPTTIAGAPIASPAFRGKATVTQPQASETPLPNRDTDSKGAEMALLGLSSLASLAVFKKIHPEHFQRLLQRIPLSRISQGLSHPSLVQWKQQGQKALQEAVAAASRYLKPVVA